jgi:hypothetical protein
MELRECKCSFLRKFLDDRFLLAQKRLEYVFGRGSRAISKDMQDCANRLGGIRVGDFYREIIKDIIDLEQPTMGRALSALCWISKSKEPLTERVLREAIEAASTEDIL